MSDWLHPEAEAGLEPMFEEARRDGKWFHCGYQNLWFSPDQLEQAQAEGRFRWGAVNWTLRDPQEYLDQAQYDVDKATRERDRVALAIAPHRG